MKKILSIFLALILVLGLAACGEKKDSSSGNVVEIQGELFMLDSTKDFHGMHYKENCVDFQSYDFDDNEIRSLSYQKGDELVFSISIFYDKDSTLSQLKERIEKYYDATEQATTVNGIDYVYYEYTDEGYPVHHYIYATKGENYTIGFSLGNDPGNIEEVFMNNVTFSR